MFFASSAVSLKLVLSGAITTNQLPITGSWAETTTSGSLTDVEVIQTVTNSTTPVSLVAAAAAGFVRKLQGLSVVNADTAAATVSVYQDDGVNTRNLIVATLAVGDVLTIADDGSWAIHNSSGALKTQASSPIGTTLTAGHIWVGNASNVAADVAPSGDWTLSNTGVATLSATIATVVTWSGAQTFTGSVTSTPAGAGVRNERYGSGAMAVSTSANDNTAVGNAALAAVASGAGGNTAVGSLAATALTTGIRTTGVGYKALQSVTTGSTNNALGAFAGGNITTGGQNVAIGYLAMLLNQTGSRNIAIGEQALYDCTVSDNIGIGNGAGQSISTGVNNVAIGSSALNVNTTGYQNFAIGVNSMVLNTTGYQNVALGYNSLSANTTGFNNVAIGAGVMPTETTGSYNIQIGVQASGTLTTGTHNILIGDATDVASASQSYGVAIGAAAVCAANEVAFGPNQNSLNYYVLSSTSTLRQRAGWTIANVDNTDATRKYRIVGNVYDTAAREWIRASGSGTAAQISFFGAPEVPQQSGDVAAGLVNLGLFSAATMTPRGGVIPNLTITTSRSSNAETITIQTIAGATPSAADPITFTFRNVTAGNGTCTVVQATGALSLTISSGSTLGAANSVAFRVWLVVFNDGGTLRLGAINCRSGTSITALRDFMLMSSTAEGGAGGATSAQVIYTGTAVSAKALRIIGYLEYTLAAAGTWNTAPAVIEIFKAGDPLPGSVIQNADNEDATTTTITGTVTANDNVPSSTDGTLYLSQAITPSAAPNILVVKAMANMANHSSAVSNVMFICQDSGNAIATTYSGQDTADFEHPYVLDHGLVANQTTSTTFKLRIGVTSGTVTVNGQNGSRFFGGSIKSYLKVQEIMA